MGHAALGYTPTAFITIILLGFCGSFQFGFQNVFYDSVVAADTLKSTTTFPEFDSGVHYPGMLFCLGASVGGLGSAMAARYFSIRIIIVGGSVASIVSEFLILFAAHYNWHSVFGAFKVIDGICTGYMTCLQINVINDMSLEMHRTALNLLTSLFVIFGQIIAVILYSLSVHANFGGAVNIVPHIFAVYFFLTQFIDPPMIKAIDDDEEGMLIAVNVFYTNATKEMAVKEIHERIRVYDCSSLKTTIWNEGVLRQALVISIIANAAAGLASDRFTWMVMVQLNDKTFRSVATALFAAVFGYLIATFVVSRFERRAAFFYSTFIILVADVSFGSIAFFAPTENITFGPLLFGIFWSRAALMGAFYAGLGSFAYFVILDLSFSPNSILMVSLPFGARMLSSAVSPLLYLFALRLNPIVYSVLASTPLVLFMGFVYFKFPPIKHASPFQIMTKLGYNMNIDATPEEIEAVKMKLHLLWTMKVSKSSDSHSE